MKFLKEQRGVTLVETLVALSLFSILAVISGAIFLDIVQLEKKSAVQNVFYEDARIILQQISNEIQGGAIDYEEYYSMNVIQEGTGGYYGINYGAYGSRFYDPGKSLDGAPTENPTDLGVECSFPAALPPADIADCEVLYTLSTDLNTGQNPFDYNGSIKDNSNALCDDPGIGGCAGTTGEVKELYLIDSTGTQKTIIARKKTTVDDDWAVGIVRMYGRDLDQNGVMDTFSCNEEFRCFGAIGSELGDIVTDVNSPFTTSEADVSAYGITLPTTADLGSQFDQINSHFVPITPRKSNITDLRFIINPIEDPYKAYSESNVQTHPSVTIIMTMGLSKEAALDYPGTFLPVTVQATVSAGVLGKITSYPPTNDVSWINGLGLKTTP